MPDYTALPWVEIREQYETTDISTRALASQWGIAAKNTLDRRIKREGWTRRIATIATHLALLQVAGEPEPPPPSDESEPVTGESLRQEQEDASLFTARALAAMQSGRVRKQLELSQQIQEAGQNILRLLIGVMTDTEDKVGEHIKRLIAICPDGEKMATLIKAAAEAIDRAVVIERRALGMDMINGRVPDPDTAEFDAYRDTAIRTVRKMDLAMGLKLREYVQQVAEDKRAERRGIK